AEYAADRHLAVLADHEFERFVDVDAGEFDQQVADLAPAHAQRDVAVGGGEHAGDGIAAAGDVDVAADAAHCVGGEYGFREQPAQLQPAGTDRGLGTDRILTGVHAHGRAHAAAGNAEIERLQPQQPGFEHEVRVHVVQRPARGLDARRLPAHVRVHRAHLVPSVGRVRKQATLRG